MNRVLVSKVRRSQRPTHWLLVGAFVLLTTALLFDLVDLSTGTGALGLLAYWLMAAGLVGGVVAGLCQLAPNAPPRRGWTPWSFTARRGFFKAVALALCAASWSLRSPEADLPPAALVMTLLGLVFAIASAWLPEDAPAIHVEEGGPTESPPARAL